MHDGVIFLFGDLLIWWIFQWGTSRRQCVETTHKSKKTPELGHFLLESGGRSPCLSLSRRHGNAHAHPHLFTTVFIATVTTVTADRGRAISYYRDGRVVGRVAPRFRRPWQQQQLVSQGCSIYSHRNVYGPDFEDSPTQKNATKYHFIIVNLHLPVYRHMIQNIEITCLCCFDTVWEITLAIS